MERALQPQLLAWKNKNNRKPLILRGARQTGKTYSLKRFGREAFGKTHYLNFEKEEKASRIFEQDLNPNRILQELAFYLDTPIDTKRDLLIFDEIQDCPHALTSLKYFSEEKSELALCSAGSLLGIHLNEASFPVGNVEFLNLYPLSFKEFLRGSGDEKSFQILNRLKKSDRIPEIIHDHLWQQLKIYFITGGLPEIIEIYNLAKGNLFEAFRTIRKKQEDLITAYIADMAKHSGKINAMHIERLWRNIPSQLAKEQNGSAPKFKFKGIIPGIQRYGRLAGVIDWLLAAGLIIKVPIVNSGRIPSSAYIQENSFKLYFFDVGLLGAISALPVKTILDYNYGSYKGYFAENFVAQEFLCGGNPEIYSWKERTAEVEFLKEVHGEVFPIEVKSGWVTQAKSLKVFNQKYSPPYTVILSAKNLHIDEAKGIHRYPLYLASRFPLV